MGKISSELLSHQKKQQRIIEYIASDKVIGWWQFWLGLTKTYIE